MRHRLAVVTAGLLCTAITLSLFGDELLTARHLASGLSAFIVGAGVMAAAPSRWWS